MIFKVLVLFEVLKALVLSEKFDFNAPLNHENNIRLGWRVEEEDQSITFKVFITKRPIPFIFGFGFSNYGGFENADFFLVRVSNNGINAVDTFTNSERLLIKDTQNDYELLEYQLEPNIELKFNRKIDTCDKHDYLIDSGTTHIIHFILNKKFTLLNDLLKKNFYLNDNSFESKDMIRTQLLKSHLISEDYERKVLENSNLEILNKNVKIPSDPTTYWCIVYKLNEKFNLKHHIVAFEGIIDERNVGIVHHMELFHCPEDPPKEFQSFSDVCTSEEKPIGLRKCRNVIAAWAMGASKFIYPQEAGGIIGGQNYSKYVVLEIHYDNEKQRDDIIDSSGIRIYYTNQLRKYDAGIMEIGLEYNSKNSIPPKNEAFNLNGYCLSDCTYAGLSSKIKVFASQLHTHLTGRKVWTTIIRQSKEIKILNSDYHYSPHFQEIRMLKKPVTIYPGDIIVNTCQYNTKNRTNMTLGGFGITDEMCVNYMHYYPVVELEVCKSSIRDDVLQEFFKKMKELDQADTSSKQSIAENFNKIRWTYLTSSILNKLYDMAPISFSCNKSDSVNLLIQNGKDITKYNAFKLPFNDFGDSDRFCSIIDDEYD